ALEVQEAGEGDDRGQPPDLDGQHQPERDDGVARVEWIAHDRVNAGGVEAISAQVARAAPRGAPGRVPDRVAADREPHHRDQEADPPPHRLKPPSHPLVELGALPKREGERGEQKERQEAPPAEQEAAVADQRVLDPHGAPPSRRSGSGHDCRARKRSMPAWPSSDATARPNARASKARPSARPFSSPTRTASMMARAAGIRGTVSWWASSRRISGASPTGPGRRSSSAAPSASGDQRVPGHSPSAMHRATPSAWDRASAGATSSTSPRASA